MLKPTGCVPWARFPALGPRDGARELFTEGVMGRLELPLAPAAEVDVGRLRAALEGRFTGEVRCDRISRALYSTDASVYQIVPLGVLLPRTEEDVRVALEVCRAFRVPLTASGGGTSQAGQAIGTGLDLDCSKSLIAIIDINPATTW